MNALQLVDSKGPRETTVVGLNFVNLLGPGETISGCSFYCEVRSGQGDPNPSLMLVGSPDLSSAPWVLQTVQGGVDGTTYLITAVVTTSNPANSPEGGLLLPVRKGGS